MSAYVFDPVEASLLEFLNGRGYPVFTDTPKVLPSGRFVQLTNVGGVEDMLTQSPMVTFTCWDSSRGKALRFASVVSADARSCRRLAGLPVYRVRTVGLPTSAPDESGRGRARFTLEYMIRGREV